MLRDVWKALKTRTSTSLITKTNSRHSRTRKWLWNTYRSITQSIVWRMWLHSSTSRHRPTAPTLSRSSRPQTELHRVISRRWQPLLDSTTQAWSQTSIRRLVLSVPQLYKFKMCITPREALSNITTTRRTILDKGFHHTRLEVLTPTPLSQASLSSATIRSVPLKSSSPWSLAM